jgi:hypothetical protein
MRDGVIHHDFLNIYQVFTVSQPMAQADHTTE